jgi:hypothetical protein
MSFLHLYLLGGLSLVALPVLVHLVTREKPKQLRFPAFRFLVQKYKTNRKKLRLHHLLLLLVRMLLILLLCLALARPRLHSERLSFLGGSQPVDVVLLFDTSSSMEFERGGLTRLDDARRRALELLNELPEGSKVAILDSSGPSSEFLDKEAAAKLLADREREEGESRANRNRGIEIRPANGPVTRQLDRACKLLTDRQIEGDGSTEPPPRCLYIFSDRTRACWDSSDVRQFKVPDGINSVFVDVGVAEPEDLAIERLVVDPVTAPPGSEVNVSAWVRATGKRADRKLICQTGRHVQEKQAQVEAGASNVYTFTYRTAPMDRPAGGEELGTGSHQVVVRLEGTDRLPFNNTRFATFVVRPGRKVLVLADEARSTVDTPEGAFNAVLLSLQYASTVRRISDVERIDLKSYNVVWLFQTEAIEDRAWGRLLDYVDNDRGKLAVVPGGLNRNWGSKDAQGLLPAELLRIERSRSSLGVPMKFEAGNTSPFMASFIKMSRERSNVDIIKSDRQRCARRYWKVKLREGGKVVARFDDVEGSPALLERDLGQGKVLLFTTKLSPESEPFPNASPLPWTTYWDGLTFILAIVDRSCRYLAGDTMAADWNYLCGDSISFPRPAKEEGLSFLLSGPGLPSQGSLLSPAKDDKENSRRELSIDRAVLPGNYTVAAIRDGKQEPFERFSLNVRPEEGVLTPQVPKEEIEAVLGRDSVLGVEHGLSLRDAIDRKPQPIDLLPWLMLALLVFLAVENLIANKRRELPPDEVARRGEVTPHAQPASKIVAPLLLWTGLGAVAGTLLGVLRGSESTGLAASIVITGLLGAAHGVLTIARFGPRDGGILGGLLGSIVGVLYGWMILATGGGIDGPLAVLIGLVLGAAVMALDGWFLGVRAQKGG